jgi:hypothetical protein
MSRTANRSVTGIAANCSNCNTVLLHSNTSINTPGCICVRISYCFNCLNSLYIDTKTPVYCLGCYRRIVSITRLQEIPVVDIESDNININNNNLVPVQLSLYKVSFVVDNHPHPSQNYIQCINSPNCDYIAARSTILNKHIYSCKYSSKRKRNS